jgi:hypothetical protein
MRMTKGTVNMTEQEAAGRIERIESDQQALGQKVYEVTAAVGKIEVGMNSLISVVRDQSESMRAIAARQNERRDTNWFGLVSSCIGVITILGAFIMLHVSPIREQVSDHHRRLEVVTERAIEQAAAAARQTETLRWLEKDYDLRQAGPRVPTDGT